MKTSNKTFNKKNFNQPSERREFKSHGFLDVISFDDGSSIGRGTFKPGWKWSNDVKPIAETDTCESSHTGYCISGSMVVRMKNGEELRIKAGDAFTIPPGHDAWVDTDETCVMLDFTGFESYAKKMGEKEKVA